MSEIQFACLTVLGGLFVAALIAVWPEAVLGTILGLLLTAIILGALGVFG